MCGYYVFFLKKARKELLYFAGAVLLGMILFLAALFVKGTVIPIVSVAFSLACGVLFYKLVLPKLPKQNMFLIALTTYIISVVLATVSVFANYQALIFISLLFQAVFHFTLFLIFYSRVVDLVHAASYQSVTDGLTGLYYKSYFIRKVQETMNSGSGSSIIFVDIDNFKKLNDSQGHLVGDQILRLTSAILKKCVGEYGIAGRYGGEELVALITNTRVSPSQIAEQFREQVQELSKDVHPITVSVGFSIFDHETERAEDYIKQADDALYMAKRLGKNRVVQFSQEWSEGDASVPQSSSNEEDRVDMSDVSDEINVPMQSDTEAGHEIMVHQEPNETHLSTFETDEPVPKHRLSSVDYLRDQESEGLNNEEQSIQEVIIQQMKVKNPFPRSRP